MGLGAALLAWFGFGRAEAAAPAAAPDQVRPTGDDVTRLAIELNAARFSGWFSQAGRSPAVLAAIADVESDFRPWVVGDDGRSIGMMQMQATTAARFGYPAAALYDWRRSVGAAMDYLRWSWDYLEHKGLMPNVELWVGSYNAGVGNIVNGNIPSSYIRKVLADWRKWERR